MVMLETYHIRVKKEYANAVIKDLEQMDAVELLPDGIPQWQMDLVKERIEEYRRNPVSLQDFDEAMTEIEKQL